MCQVPKYRISAIGAKKNSLSWQSGSLNYPFSRRPQQQSTTHGVYPPDSLLLRLFLCVVVRVGMVAVAVMFVLSHQIIPAYLLEPLYDKTSFRPEMVQQLGSLLRAPYNTYKMVKKM